ncbi:MAG TPA: bifunctional (p)ppGpp synthetase/guanosine-3',5'-bis(diphosphate) 3'-pyrophosphohydrolase [bacterium]|nr:bifunctional (p)ppGpp synthetase/guanosine-3',5'-bis(diphosphate) 3'-pyrophosphohydrolase [bacterium]
MISSQELVQSVQSYNPKADSAMLAKAYEFSRKVHEGQKRCSGDPYFIHPVEVAAILAQMQLDAASIAAGLLHDTVEDTLIPIDEIKKEFGPEIALLVDGVTKLSKIKFSSSEEKQAENFRKMMLAMAVDIRVILIKLADRLNNMRTLQHLSVERQTKIAKETVEIYAPLANRLGIQWMKVELEDLSLRYLKPEIYGFIHHQVDVERQQREAYMDRVREIVEQKLKEYNVSARISGRVKHVYSIYRKMESQNIAFDQVHDILAFRIIVDNIRQCYEVLGVLHELWKPVPGRFKDYIAMPKVNNYRSLHTTVVCLDGERVEFQIRTLEMHEIAEKGIAAHWTYKEDGSISQNDQAKFQWLRELLDLQKDLKDPAEFLDTVKLDLFATDVYVFTPKGQLKELPYGSTPIDFAFSIHSDVGNQCVGAKVNDKIVPLDYILKSGDTVQVLTRSGSKPNRDWLRFVKTSRAKAKIRQQIRDEQRDRALSLGKELLEKEIEHHGVTPGKYLKEDNLLQAAREFGLKNVESLIAQVGYGKISPHHVTVKLLPAELMQKPQAPEPSPASGVLGEMFQKVKKRSKSAIKVGGLNDVLVSMGKCCNPLPGDSITGFITRGRGVTVHTVDCAKVMATDPDRRVEVGWDESSELNHQAKVRAVSVDRPGILASMTKTISNLGVNISQANIRTSNDQKAINIFVLDIRNRHQLQDVVRALESLAGVISVDQIRS